jgi:glucose dehydrogenase
MHYPSLREIADFKPRSLCQAAEEVGGKQFVVIAAGGGKWGSPLGGSYVAFALPGE